jgi:hypothetical protein
MFQRLALPRLQVIKPTLLGPLEGDNHNLWTTLSQLIGAILAIETKYCPQEIIGEH